MAEMRRLISAKRLMEGGLAILKIDIKNHQREILGNKHNRPLVRKILRVEVAS